MLKKVIYSVLAVLAVFFLIFMYISFFIGLERKNIFYPHIDTRFSINFNPDKFSNIRNGMRADSVELILGKPIDYISYRKNGIVKINWNKELQAWSQNSRIISAYYSADGKWKYADFAWEGFIIDYDSNGYVTQTMNRWFYD